MIRVNALKGKDLFECQKIIDWSPEWCIMAQPCRFDGHPRIKYKS